VNGIGNLVGLRGPACACPALVPPIDATFRR
jgi:hypothetical protein